RRLPDREVGPRPEQEELTAGLPARVESGGGSLVFSLPMTEPDPGIPADKVRSYPCPGCGATLVFDPKDGSLACPYSGRTEAIPSSASEVRERSYDEYLKVRPERMAQPVAGGLDVKCGECGATVTFPGAETAGDCPFCGTSLVAAPRSAEPWVAPEG